MSVSHESGAFLSLGAKSVGLSSFIASSPKYTLPLASSHIVLRKELGKTICLFPFNPLKRDSYPFARCIIINVTPLLTHYSCSFMSIFACNTAHSFNNMALISSSHSSITVSTKVQPRDSNQSLFI